MGQNVILYPTHEGYCKECVYYEGGGICTSKSYIKNSYMVNCVWGYCKYKKVKSDKSSQQSTST